MTHKYILSMTVNDFIYSALDEVQNNRISSITCDMHDEIELILNKISEVDRQKIYSYILTCITDHNDLTAQECI